jgi:hypothetical protein
LPTSKNMGVAPYRDFRSAICSTASIVDPQQLL